MHLILVSNRLATPRTWTITPRVVVLAVLSLLAVIVSVSLAFAWFAFGIARDGVGAGPISAPVASRMSDYDRSRGSLTVMASQLGKMQAELIRLDSLGERVARLAGLPAGERIGQGGPLVLEAASSSEPELRRALDRLEQILEQRSDTMTVLESQLLDERARNSLLPSLSPIAGARIGSTFGGRIDPMMGIPALHEGVDFIAEPGTPVLASAGGVVTASEWHAQYGMVVDIDHGNDLSSRYAHLSRIDVEPGQIIKRGQRIGTSGNSGRSTGPHLHFEVRLRGVAQDPERFLRLDSPIAAASSSAAHHRL